MKKFGSEKFKFDVDENGVVSNMVGNKDVFHLFMAEMVSQSIKTGLNADESCQIANNALRALTKSREKQPKQIWSKLWNRFQSAFFWGVFAWQLLLFPLIAYYTYGWDFEKMSIGLFLLRFPLGFAAVVLILDFCAFWALIGIKAGISGIKVRRLKAHQQSTGAQG